jgi:hypothetical protein
MKPEGLSMINESLGSDEIGELWFKDSDDNWETLDDITARSEKSVDEYIRSLFSDGLVNENDAIQIRVLNGRLRWIKSDKMDEKWQELTPTIARRIEARTIEEEHDAIEALAKAVRVEEQKRLNTMEIGWYQDTKGDLYQFDGKTWLGKVPSKNQIDTLEFLG